MGLGSPTVSVLPAKPAGSSSRAAFVVAGSQVSGWRCQPREMAVVRTGAPRPRSPLQARGHRTAALRNMRNVVNGAQGQVRELQYEILSAFTVCQPFENNATSEQNNLVVYDTKGLIR